MTADLMHGLAERLGHVLRQVRSRWPGLVSSGRADPEIAEIAEKLDVHEPVTPCPLDRRPLHESADSEMAVEPVPGLVQLRNPQIWGRATAQLGPQVPEELGNLRPEQRRVMTPRPCIRQRAEPVETIRRALPAHHASRPPISLGCRTLRFCRRTPNTTTRTTATSTNTGPASLESSGIQR